MTTVDILNIIANDNRMILYRPEWRKETGSVTASILLSQIIYRYDKAGRKAFYKFRQPCENKYYFDGDSWTEELGFSKKEFDNALKLIAKKITRKKSTEHDKPVEYWTEIDRRTYYKINEINLSAFIERVYGKHEPAKEFPQPDISDLFALVKIPLNTGIEKAVKKALKKYSFDYVKSAIFYTNDHSTEPNRYKNYFELTIQNGWGEGYEPKYKPAPARPSKPLPPEPAPEPVDISELAELIPVPMSNVIESILTVNVRKHGAEYVKAAVLYANEQDGYREDRPKYRKFLEKCLKNGWNA